MSEWRMRKRKIVMRGYCVGCCGWREMMTWFVYCLHVAEEIILTHGNNMILQLPLRWVALRVLVLSSVCCVNTCCKCGVACCVWYMMHAACCMLRVAYLQVSCAGRGSLQKSARDHLREWLIMILQILSSFIIPLPFSFPVFPINTGQVPTSFLWNLSLISDIEISHQLLLFFCLLFSNISYRHWIVPILYFQHVEQTRGCREDYQA